MELRDFQGAYEVGTSEEPAAELARWQMRRLHEIAEIRTGIAKNSAAQIADPVIVHYLRVANVQDGYLDLSEMKTLRVSRSDLSRYNVRPGDVLMNEGGDLDKLGRGAIWRGEYNPCVHQNHVFVVRCGAQVLPEFLNAWTAGADARRYFLLAGRQTTNLASINKTSLGELPVALPSLAEQEAIAKALSDTDALIESLEQLIAKKRLIKQGAMQELLTGKRRLPGFSGKWRPIEFGDVVNPVSQRAEPSRVQSETLCIELEHIAQSEGVLTGGVTAADCVSLKAIFQPGDVLFGKLRPYLRKYWLATCDGICSTEFWVLRSQPEKMLSSYLRHVVETREFVECASTSTGTRMPRADWKIVRELPLVVPELEEQRAISQVLVDMGNEVEAIVRRLDKTRRLKQAMTRELLTGRVRLV